MIATPVAASTMVSAAIATDVDCQTDLRFDVSGEGKETKLHVTEYYSGNDSDAGIGCSAALAPPWTISLLAFGPSATYRFKASANKYELRIDRVSFGGQADNWISFSFERKDEWEIKVETDFWRSELFEDSKNPFSLGPAPFRKFMTVKRGDKTDFGVAKQYVKAERIDNTFFHIFDSLVRAPSGLFTIRLDRDLSWTVQNKDLAALNAFDGAVVLATMRFYWFEQDMVAPDGTKADRLAVTADIEIVPLAAPLVVGDRTGPHLSLALSDPKTGTLQLQSPGPNSGRAEIRLLAHRWDITFEDPPQAIVAGPFKATKGFVAREGIEPKLESGKYSTGFKVRVRSYLAPDECTLPTPVGVMTIKGPLTEKEIEEATDEESSPLRADGDKQAIQAGAELLANVSINCHALACSAAVEEASHSKLKFQATALSFLYGLPQSALLASYVRLDVALTDRDNLAARIDLSRSTLSVARAPDLVSLKFRFADLALAFAADEVAIVSYDDDCRIISRNAEKTKYEMDSAKPAEESVASEPERDLRPVLVVEFPPQHVMEEALFLPGLPPLPSRDTTKDADGKTEFQVEGSDDPPYPRDAEMLLQQLENKLGGAINADRRKKIREAWLKETGVPNAPDEVDRFAASFKMRAALLKDLPVDQQIYIGPFGLDPDALALARDLQKQDKTLQLAAMCGQMFAQVEDQYSRMATNSVQPDLETALLYQKRLEEAVPSYQVFRTYYREHMTDSALGLAHDDASLFPEGDPAKGLAVDELEYFLTTPTDGYPTDGVLKRRSDEAKTGYLAFLAGADRVPDLVAARLSKPSRLAFRVNCGRSAPGKGANGNRPETGVFADRGFYIPFSLSGLTDWSLHELAVTRRAERLYDPDASGNFPPIQERSANLNDVDMLRRQGFSTGAFVTAQQRLSEIAGSLRVPPTALETAIDLPARVIMSTAQNAVWQVPYHFSAKLFSDSTGASTDIASTVPGRRTAADGDYGVLWYATVDTEAADPGLRVVHSPDLRPDFVWSRSQRQDSEDFFKKDAGGILANLPGNAAPPRGPLAPWLLGPERTAYPLPSALAVFNGLSEADKTQLAAEEVIDEASFCKVVKDTGGQARQKFGLPALIDYLCQLATAKDTANKSALKFRTSLDAYDRHELVLLSSAYGLPVLGRRDEANNLMRDSSQFEPGEAYRLIDIEAGSAIYRPQSLVLKELTLTALGGTFRHDTPFVPPASAKHIVNRNLFDALSIERWQHWTVLGRDVFTEVVYKGFLFPLGHRASLVKVTERTFLRSTDNKTVEKNPIKAYLRQRLYIRCGKPEKRFPALRQPNDGRQFPVNTARILTITTPDIVDPTTSLPFPQKESVDPKVIALEASGRLRFAAAPGLAFWPRTALSNDADIMFDVDLDGVHTSLPLIFVDNVAAHDKRAIAGLVEYYNGLLSPDKDAERDGKAPTGPVVPPKATVHKRSMAFGGQAMRYCEELKPGDSTYETVAWTVKAQGRRHVGPPEEFGEGANTIYDYDPQMEGADQPPFYPAVQTAQIRLKQAERFSGSLALPLRAQFDGRYVLKGFLGDYEQNPLDVFLDLVEPQVMTVGSNGDRTGGMFRPETNFMAISRKNGPLGGKPSTDLTGAGDEAIELPGKLINRAKNYINADNPKLPTASLTVAVPPEKENGPGLVAVFKRYFAPDTKLLGIIRIWDLLKYMGLPSPADALPLLKEVLEYGLSGLASSAANFQEVVKNNVIDPLLEVVTDLEKRWFQLQQEVKKAQGPIAAAGLEPMTLAQAYPELAPALADLTDTLKRAQAASDPLVFTAELAGVYESGKRFINALERIGANPVGRFEVAFIERVREWSEVLQMAVADIPAALKGVSEKFLEQAREKLIEAIVPGADLDATTLALSIPMPELFTGLTDPANKWVAKVAEQQGTINLTVGEAREALRQLFNDGPAGEDLDTRLKRVAADFVVKPVKKKAETAGDALVAFANQELGDLYLEEAKRLQVVLQGYEALLDSYVADGVDFAAEMALGFLPEFAQLARIFDELKNLKKALEAPNYEAAATAALRLLELIGEPINLPADIEDARKAIASLVTGALRTLRNALGETALCVLPTQTEIETCNTNPAGGLLACLASKPVPGGGPETLCTRLYYLADTTKRIADRLEAAKTQLEFVPEYKGSITKLSNGLLNLVKNANNLHEAAFADALAIRDVIGKLPNADGLKPGEVVDISLPTTAAELKRLLQAKQNLLVHMRDLLVATQTLIEENAELLGAFAASSAVLWLVNPEADKDKLEALKKEIAALQSDLARLVAKALAQIFKLAGSSAWLVDKADESVKPIREALDKLATLAANWPAMPLKSAIADLNNSSQQLAKDAQFFEGAAKSLEAFPGTSSLSELLKLNLAASPFDSTKQLNLKELLSKNGEKFAAIIKDFETAEQKFGRLPEAARQTLSGLGDQVFLLLEAPMQAIVKGGTIAGAKWPGIVTLYDNLVAGRETADSAINKLAFPEALKSRLTALLRSDGRDYQKPFKTPAGDQLAEDQAWLKAIALDSAPFSDKTKAPAYLAFVKGFLVDWKNNDSAPLRIEKEIEDLGRELLQGNFAALIDIAAIREEVERQLLNLIPTKATLGFKFGAPFSGKTKDATGGIFEPVAGASLNIDVNAKVDFLNPGAVDFKVNGTLGAFKINLIGQYIDAVSLIFSGADFTIGKSGKPDLNVYYHDFKIGKDLEFVQQLQSLFGPKDGSGFYLVPLASQPGIEAGYGLGVPIVSFGTVSFSNISLNAGVAIPFGGGDTRFKASLSRRDSPFTISVAPYGGSGFFGIEANAKGIVGFEASFEYGGAGAFQYGPLSGQGRIMAGIYIRQMKIGEIKVTEIMGTFFAGGSASIWIFHFASSLYVRLGMSSGNMVGEAVFTFSFSCGFADFDFSIAVARKENKVGSGNSSSIQGITKFAQIGDPKLSSSENDGGFGARFRNITTCQGKDWQTYRQYFDGSIEPAIRLFQ